jgi:hypothetical protein
VAYSTTNAVKRVLHIEADDDTHDTEIGECIASADAIVDGLLKKANLSFPESVPQLITDQCPFCGLIFS